MKIVMKILLWGLGIIVVVALVLGGLFLHQIKKTLTTAGKIVEWNDSEGTTYKDLRYGDGTRNTYDLIIPANGQPTALMLFIHGGAWMGVLAFIPLLGDVISVTLGFMRANVVVTTISIFLGKALRYAILIWAINMV